MLSYLDPILFPDECQVVELTPGYYVYPIFKNGSSGIREKSTRTLSIKQINQLENINIYLRDPFDRYVSGVQSYLRLNPHLERGTALSIINEYLFLNRHFSLQFHWLMNLQRYTNNVLMTFHPIAELDTTVGETWHSLTRDQTLINYFNENKKLHYYLQLDKTLIEEFVGKTVRFKDILVHIRTFYPELYKETIERSRDLCIVLD